MFAFGTGIYMITNHFHATTPQELPFTWVDRAVPFVPETLWLYFSEYVFFTVAYVTARNTRNLNKYVYAFLSLQILSCLIFWVWPTTYPRALFPLPDNIDSVTRYFFLSLRETDTPANCCPSLHVSATFLTAFIFLRDQRRYFPFFITWAVVIALSTMTTKQHYAADVVSGLGFAMIHYWVFFRWMPYESAEESAAQAIGVSGAQAKR